MRNPSSIVRGTGRRLRRPSPALVVSGVALFMSIGGASYAAVSLPAHSVGSTQLKTYAVTNPKLAKAAVGTSKIMNSAVTFNKIKPSSVGTVRIVKTQVQERLKNSCQTGQAISAVDVNGKATCVPSGPVETNSTAGTPVNLTSATTAATVNSLPLASGFAYTVQSNPYITVTPSTDTTALSQHVVVTCTLTAGSTAARRSVSVDLPAAGDNPQVQYLSIPLTVVAPSSTSATNATVACTNNVTVTSGSGAGNPATNPATATAQGAIYATQLASATTATTTTTTTTPSPSPAP